MPGVARVVPVSFARASRAAPQARRGHCSQPSADDGTHLSARTLFSDDRLLQTPDAAREGRGVGLARTPAPGLRPCCRTAPQGAARLAPAVVMPAGVTGAGSADA